MEFLNLGCGNIFLPDCTNIDFNSTNEHVLKYDLLKGIPFNDLRFDVVYHSHILEHFPKKYASVFLSECYRVLRYNGIIRIIVPDLEMIVKEYLKNLNQVINKRSEINLANYQWSVIELLDQLTRNENGGEMLKYWKNDNLINERYIIERTGEEYLNYKNKKQVIVNLKKKDYFKKVRNILKKFLFLINKESTTKKLGEFRSSGENHLWMYDRFSLIYLLEKIGFKEIEIKSGFESNIYNWDHYSVLDVKGNKIRKPDSLFIEARK